MLVIGPGEQHEKGQTLFMTQVRCGALLLLIAFSPFTRAATLKPETVAAWDAYLQQATAAMQARLQPGATFLWLEEEPGRMEFVRTKGPLIGPVNKHIPLKVSHGLIHDWLGAGFVPNARIEDILRVVRDYNSYKRIYRPGVIDSLSHGSEGEKDLFFMRLANHSVVSKTALDTECEAHYIRLDDHRWYAYSNTIRIQELAHFLHAGTDNPPRRHGYGPHLALVQHCPTRGARWRSLRGTRSASPEPRYPNRAPRLRNADRSPRLPRFARDFSPSEQGGNRRSIASSRAGPACALARSLH